MDERFISLLAANGWRNDYAPINASIDAIAEFASGAGLSRIVPPMLKGNNMYGFFKNYDMNRHPGADALLLRQNLAPLERFPLVQHAKVVCPGTYFYDLFSTREFQSTSVLAVAGKGEIGYGMTLFCLSAIPEHSWKTFEMIDDAARRLWPLSSPSRMTRNIPQNLPELQALSHFSTLIYLGRGLYGLNVSNPWLSKI